MMKAVGTAAVAAAFSMMSVQPALAAAHMEPGVMTGNATSALTGNATGRPAAFAGASLRLDLSKAKPRMDARLQAGMTRTQGINGAAPARLRGFELGRSGDGKAAFYVNGMEAREARQRLGVKGSPGTYVLIGAGVLLLVVLAAYASASADLLDTCGDGPECTD